LPPERFLTAPEDLLAYSYDGTAGLRQRPAAVVFPESADEVAEILAEASRTGTAVVTRGSGTGLSGGSVPVEGGLVLCTTRMNRILELDRKNLTLLAEPGVLTRAIHERVSAHGLFYPPDPSSQKISTLGGNVANNSGGLRGLKYGVTRDYVMGLEVVSPQGEIFWLGNKCVKDVAGYSLRDLYIGSEGTLGVITKVLLKLVPAPSAKRTLLATYASMEAAAATVSAIIAEPIIPCTLEFLDRKTLHCVEEYTGTGLPTEAEALLFMETDGHPAAVEEEAMAMERIARAEGALEVRTASDSAEAARLGEARRSAFAALARLRPTTILEDATVPRSELARMIAFVGKTADKHGLEVATFGHFGDGNLHPTFLTDERDPEEMERVHAAFAEIFEYALSLGGTITGEHGVGISKREFLAGQYDEGSLALLRQLKATLDPQGILNPGKLLPA
jgi:glycolate oxidase